MDLPVGKNFTHGIHVREINFAHGFPVGKNFTHGIHVREINFAHGFPVREINFAQGFPVRNKILHLDSLCGIKFYA